MSSKANAGDTGPLFVLATRMYVHYKFKTRSTFSPEAALIDDDYAREVLQQVRITRDKALLEMADRFEAARFPAAAEPAQAESGLDLSFETPG
jgi:hypothetical protein